MITKQSLVVFDLDGTLINSYSHVIRSMNYAVHPWGIKLAVSDLEKMRHRMTADLFEGMGLSKDEQQEALQRLSRAHDEIDEACSLFDGVREIFDFLDAHQIPMAIWTGRDTESAVEILTQNDVIDYFKVVLGNTSLPVNKPNPFALFEISKKFSVPLSSMVMIGDHHHDILGGKNAGCKTVLVKWAPKNPYFDDSITPDYSFDTPEELLHAMEGQLCGSL